jgi:hypothetical protein
MARSRRESPQVAERLTDPGARKAMLELADSFDPVARAAATLQWSSTRVGKAGPEGRPLTSPCVAQSIAIRVTLW